MIGYITYFSDVRLIDHGDFRGGNLLTSGQVVHPRVYSLTNLEKVNFDGARRSPILPGILTQRIVCLDGGRLLFNRLETNYLGHSADIRFEDLGGAIYAASSIFVKVIDSTRIKISKRTYMIIDATFELLHVWRPIT